MQNIKKKKNMPTNEKIIERERERERERELEIGGWYGCWCGSIGA